MSITLSGSEKDLAGHHEELQLSTSEEDGSTNKEDFPITIPDNFRQNIHRLGKGPKASYFNSLICKRLLSKKDNY